MTTHLTEDELLAVALETGLSDSAAVQSPAHLVECRLCQERLRNLLPEVALLGSLSPEVKPIAAPNRRRQKIQLLPLLRACAFIIFGIIIGMTTSKWRQEPPMCVTPAYSMIISDSHLPIGRSVADATSVAAAAEFN